MTQGVTIELAGREYLVPPFMLAELEAAAPHIDRMNELESEFRVAIKEGRTPTAATSLQLTRELVEILAIGIGNVDAEMTAEKISKMVNFSFVPSLTEAVHRLLESSGLTPGEAKAPSASSAKGARASKSR